MVVDDCLDYDKNHAVCACQVDKPEGRLIKKLLGCHKIPLDEEKQPKEEADVEGKGKGKSSEKIVTKSIKASTWTGRGDVRVANKLSNEGDEEVCELNELKMKKNHQIFTIFIK